MNKLKYDKLEISKKLSSITYDVVKTGLKAGKEKTKLNRKIIGIAVAILIVMIMPLNTIPSYAKEVQQIPVIGEIAKIFTFREYHVEDKIKYIDIKIPQFSNEGKTDLEKRVNQ